ncbi:MAG: PAS domain S-box protein [Bacteroidota bacterium]|nr:PAS domain S-box protein [Bacteroidota bacterium]
MKNNNFNQLNINGEELEKYKAIFEHSPDACLIIKNEVFVDCNEAAAQMIGGTKADIIGKKPHEISPLYQSNGKLSEAYAKELVSEAIVNKKINFEWQHKKVDGTLFWSSISLSFFILENETIILTNWRDITENKKTNDALEASEARFKQISEHIKAVIWETDLNGKYTYINALSELVFGYKPEELIGKYFYDLHPEEDREAYKNTAQSLLNKGITLVDFENPIVKKDGTLIWVSTNGTPKKNVKGEPIGYFGSDVEITQKKLALDELRKFRIISDQAYYGAAITNLEGNISYLNNAFAAMHGYTPDELIGKHLSIFHTEEQMKTVVPLLERIKTDGGFDLAEVEHVRRDGRSFPTLMTAKLICNEQKIPQFLSATLIDITDRKRYEEEILDLNQNLDKKIKERTTELHKSNIDLFYARVEAEESNKSKSEFLSRMSHELRTPMNAILGFAQLLEMGQLSASQEKSVKHILKSGQHLLNLINEVLDISRIESGKVSISIEPVLLADLVQEVTEILSPAISDKNIHLQVESDTIDKIYVKADKQRLKQILINLLNNAVKYNKEKGQIWVASEKITPKNTTKKVRVYIKDTGIGIDSKNLEKIFTPFERIGAERTGVEGTGLGLAVVKQLANLMQSKVGVYSELGVGSTFWIDLPICTSTIEKAAIESIIPLEDETSANSVGTILYIEDNMANIDLVTQVVLNKRKGLKLISNMYGKNAVDLCISYQPKLVLLDLHLPDVHGNDVAASILAHPKTKNIPIIVISADISANNIKFLNSIGVKKFIPKPIDLKELLESIDKFIK